MTFAIIKYSGKWKLISSDIKNLVIKIPRIIKLKIGIIQVKTTHICIQLFIMTIFTFNYRKINFFSNINIIGTAGRSFEEELFGRSFIRILDLKIQNLLSPQKTITDNLGFELLLANHSPFLVTNSRLSIFFYLIRELNTTKNMLRMFF